MKHWGIISIFVAIMSMFGAVGIVLSTAQAQLVILSPLFIISPAPGEVIAEDAVSFEATVPEGFELVNPEIFSKHKVGQGHLHIWLDAIPDHSVGTSVVLTERPSHTFENVFSGLHTIHAEIYRNDHARYDPAIATEVHFETFKELLKSPDDDEIPPGAPPVSSGGLFLPPEGGNSLAVIIVVVIIFGLLWYFFGRKNSR